MTEPATRLEGVVLCRVGDARLAIAARDVVAFAAAAPEVVYAGRAFGLGPGDAEPKAVRSAHASVSVDSIEVTSDALAVLPVPGVLRRLDLHGFVETRGALWPLVGLDGLAAMCVGGSGNTLAPTAPGSLP